MKYVILEKARPYTRTRRGKFERVRGYAGKQPISKDRFIQLVRNWQENEKKSAFRKLVALFKEGDVTARKLSKESKIGLPDEITLYRYASFPRGTKKLKIGQKLRLKPSSWSSSIKAAEGTGAITGAKGMVQIFMKTRVPKKFILYRLNKIYKSPELAYEKEHIVDRMKVKVLRENPQAMHEGKMNFVDVEIRE